VRSGSASSGSVPPTATLNEQLRNTPALRLILPFFLDIYKETGAPCAPVSFNESVTDADAIAGVVGLHFPPIEAAHVLDFVNKGAVVETLNVVNADGNAMVLGSWDTLMQALYDVRLILRSSSARSSFAHTQRTAPLRLRLLIHSPHPITHTRSPSPPLPPSPRPQESDPTTRGTFKEFASKFAFNNTHSLLAKFDKGGAINECPDAYADYIDSVLEISNVLELAALASLRTKPLRILQLHLASLKATNEALAKLPPPLQIFDANTVALVHSCRASAKSTYWKYRAKISTAAIANWNSECGFFLEKLGFMQDGTDFDYFKRLLGVGNPVADAARAAAHAASVAQGKKMGENLWMDHTTADDPNCVCGGCRAGRCDAHDDEQDGEQHDNGR
jgi:hypothetical protein